MIIRTFVTGLAGAFFLSASIEGYLLRRTSLVERFILFVGGVFLIDPGAWTDIFGILMVGVITFLQWYGRKPLKAKLAEGSEP